MLDTLAAEALPAEAARKGEVLKAGLQDLARRHACIAEVRGRGLAIGVQIRGAATPLQDDAAATAALMFHAHRRGIVAYCVGPSSNVLELTPALTITDHEIGQALSLLEEVILNLEAGQIDEMASAAFAGW